MRKNKYPNIHIKQKKGYFQIDFIFAIVIFFTFYLLTYSFYISGVNAQIDTITVKELHMDARDICKILIVSPGTPINWHTDTSKMTTVGLKQTNSTYLNSSKVSAFAISNYFNITNTFNLTGKNIYTEITGLESNTSYTTFGADSGYDSKKARSICYSYYNNEIVEVMVEVWKWIKKRLLAYLK